MLVDTITEPDDWFVEAIAVGDPTFDQIHDLVKKSFKEKKIDDDLRQLYEKRRTERLHIIEKLIEKYEESTFGAKKVHQLRVLRATPEKAAIAQKLETHARQVALSKPNRKKALEDLNRLLVARAMVKDKAFSFSMNDFDRTIDGKKPILGISYKIWKPDLMHQIYTFEDEYQNFPLKWLGSKFTVWQYEYLYQKWKEGHNLENLLEKFYDKEDSFKSLRTACKSNPYELRRIPLVEEIIRNYQDNRYASTVAFALTQIEGAIWDIAITLHNIGVETIFNKSKIGFEEHRSFKLINEKGVLIDTEPTVGLLVRCTQLKKYIYAPFLDYCAQELFKERNPILHGRKTTFGTKIEANKKLLALEMMLSTLQELLVNNADIFLRHVLRKDFEKFEQSLKEGNSKEAFETLRNVIEKSKNNTNE